MCDSDLDCGALYFCNLVRMRCEPLPGTVAEGSSCTSDLQCRAGLLCDGGTCEALRMPDGPSPTRLAVLEYVILVSIVVAVGAMLVPVALVCLPSGWTVRLRQWLGIKTDFQRQQQRSTINDASADFPSAYVFAMDAVSTPRTILPQQQYNRRSHAPPRTPPNSPVSEPEYDPRLDDNDTLPPYENAPPTYDDVVHDNNHHTIFPNDTTPSLFTDNDTISNDYPTASLNMDTTHNSHDPSDTAATLNSSDDPNPIRHDNCPNPVTSTAARSLPPS